jgi:hypothetical protein
MLNLRSEDERDSSGENVIGDKPLTLTLISKIYKPPLLKKV